MAENSQAVIPDNLIIVDGEIGGGVPSSSPSDAGKVLTVDSEGDPSWVTPSGGTQYSEGNGIDISNENVISVDTTVVATQSDLSGYQPTISDLETIRSGAEAGATAVQPGSLATVATSGSYNDLSNKPTIPTVAQSYNALSTDAMSGTAVAEAISGTGQVPSVTSNDDGKVLKATYEGGVGSFGWDAAPSGVPSTTSADNGKVLGVTDTSGTLGWVAQTPAQVNSDWNAASGAAQILNKPTLATVATSGSYNDLSNKPSIPAAQIQSDWNQTNDQAVDFIKNKPTIPAAQVNADWTASSGVSQILNKPTLATVATSGSYNDLSNKPTIPTVDQTYNSASTNAQSGTAVANAISAVKQVPASTSADEDKVLTVNSSGNAVWAAAQGSSYTFSNPIKETSGTVSLDYDTDTLSASTTSWTQFDTFNSSASGDAKFRASQGYLIAESLNFGGPYSTISLHIPGNTYFSQNYASSKSYFISLSTDSYIAPSTDRTITYIGHPLATEEVTLSGSTRTAVAEQDVVINYADLSNTSLWTPKQFNFSGEIYLGLVIADTSTTSPANEPLTSVDDAETVPVKYSATVAAPLTVKNPVPSFSTSTDAGKVLTVGSNGTEWVNSVPIEVVAAMPANPTSGVLYIVTG